VSTNTTETPEPSKQCTTCGDVKPLSDYYKRSDAPDGKQRACKVCQKTKSKANSLKPETKERRKERDADRVEAIREYSRKYREENHERELTRQAEWRANGGSEIDWSRTAMNRAIRLGAPRVERLERLDVFERDRHLCQMCGAKVEAPGDITNPLSAVVDHITPLAEGGSHVLENVQTMHNACNLAKHDKSIAALIAEDVKRRGALTLAVFRLALLYPEQAFPEAEADAEQAA
jgi:5-methylcytosine-specific restriction endonuclease McrA